MAQLKRLSQIAIIRQYEEPIIEEKGVVDSGEIDDNEPTPTP